MDGLSHVAELKLSKKSKELNGATRGWRIFIIGGLLKIGKAGAKGEILFSISSFEFSRRRAF